MKIKRVYMISDDQMLAMSSLHPRTQYGFSVYKNVLIRWDEDHDPRVLQMIRDLPRKVRKSLLVVQESEGTLAMVWGGEIPRGFQVDDSIGVNDDEWGIFSSTAAESSVETESEWSGRSCCNCGEPAYHVLCPSCKDGPFCRSCFAFGFCDSCEAQDLMPGGVP